MVKSKSVPTLPPVSQNDVEKTAELQQQIFGSFSSLQHEKTIVFLLFYFGIVGVGRLSCRLFSSPTPISHKHDYYGVTRGFTRLIITIKYACYDLNKQIFVTIKQCEQKNLQVGEK